MKISKISVVAGVSMVFIGGLAQAAVATGTMTVSAVVAPLNVTCSVSPPATVAMPSMVPGLTGGKSQPFVVSLTCSQTTPYSVAFASANGGAAGGKLNGSNCTMNYGLYSSGGANGLVLGTTDYLLNPAPGGTGTGGIQQSSYALSAPIAQPGCVLAANAAGQTVTDTITVSVNY